MKFQLGIFLIFLISLNSLYCSTHDHDNHHHKRKNKNQPKNSVVKRTTLAKHNKILKKKIRHYKNMVSSTLKAAQFQKSKCVQRSMEKAADEFKRLVSKLKDFRHSLKKDLNKEQDDLEKIRKTKKQLTRLTKKVVREKALKQLKRVLRINAVKRLSIRFRSIRRRRLSRRSRSHRRRRHSRRQSRRRSELHFLESRFRRRGISKISKKLKSLAKKAKTKITKSMKKKAEKQAQSWDEKKLAETCSKSFFDSLPPSFCWKKGADFGRIPTGCPPGYFRHLALCFKHCKPGYTFDGGALCLRGCPSGYTTYPLTCTYWTWKFWEIRTIGRDPYFPHSITNFDAPCQSGYYRMGALCYRDCANIGMVNCGIGMCAASGDACAEGLTSMLTDFFSGLGKAIGFVLSFGSSSAASGALGAAKTAIKTASKAAQKAIKNSIQVVKRIAKNKNLRKKILNKVKSTVKGALKEFVMGDKDKKQAENVCDQVADGLMDRMEQSSGSGFDIKSLDVLGIGDIVSSCSNIKDSNGGVGCAKSILTMLDNVDPTGLAGMAAAFMQPVCDV